MVEQDPVRQHEQIRPSLAACSTAFQTKAAAICLSGSGLSCAAHHFPAAVCPFRGAAPGRIPDDAAPHLLEGNSFIEKIRTEDVPG